MQKMGVYSIISFKIKDHQKLLLVWLMFDSEKMFLKTKICSPLSLFGLGHHNCNQVNVQKQEVHKLT